MVFARKCQLCIPSRMPLRKILLQKKKKNDLRFNYITEYIDKMKKKIKFQKSCKSDIFIKKVIKQLMGIHAIITNLASLFVSGLCF